jgi:ABC-type multidrug transport system ATPase subunit
MFGFLGANGAGKTPPLLMLLVSQNRQFRHCQGLRKDPARDPLEVKRRWATCRSESASTGTDGS